MKKPKQWQQNGEGILLQQWQKKTMLTFSKEKLLNLTTTFPRADVKSTTNQFGEGAWMSIGFIVVSWHCEMKADPQSGVTKHHLRCTPCHMKAKQICVFIVWSFEIKDADIQKIPFLLVWFQKGLQLGTLVHKSKLVATCTCADSHMSQLQTNCV